MTTSTSEASLPMDPMMEAFFVAVALELGTQTGPDWLVNRSATGLPVSSAEKMTQSLRTANAQIEAREFMMKHPGAPAVFEKLRRMHRESAGGLRKQPGYVDVEEMYFWDQMAYAYIQWCRSQPSA